MLEVNLNYAKLPGNYLFRDIAVKVKEYKENDPKADVISLGIGDVTKPLPKACTEAMHKAVDEMTSESTFRGYAPDLGYSFLRRAIIKYDYNSRGIEFDEDEIFVSDGAKCDTGNFGELFDVGCRIAICDPVYPVYIDTNVMAGRSGDYDRQSGKWSNVIYLVGNEENNFTPTVPDLKGDSAPDIIYLCYPNNPTGTAITKDALQKWVDYALENDAVIMYDAAYEAYITEDLPHSIYECRGAKECCVEFRSFSKNAGFTGVRCGFVVVPKQLKIGTTSLNGMWTRRHSTKFNGVSYITQRAAEAVYTPEGQSEIDSIIKYYLDNSKLIGSGLLKAGYKIWGGVNSPYIWLKTPDGMSSWSFFDYLLKDRNVVGTPGCGFGPSGEGYFRLTAFGTRENTIKAIERICK